MRRSENTTDANTAAETTAPAAAAAAESTAEPAPAPAVTVTYPVSVEELQLFAEKVGAKNRAGIQSLPIEHVQAWESLGTAARRVVRLMKEKK